MVDCERRGRLCYVCRYDPFWLPFFQVADISRRVDLEDVAEESRKLPIKAISLEQVRSALVSKLELHCLIHGKQATKSLEAPLESLVTLEQSPSPVACLLTFVPETQQLRVTASAGIAFGQLLFEGDLKTAIAVVGGHYPNAWSGTRCQEDLLFRRMRFAVLWEKTTLAIEAVTRDSQELWVTNLNAVMQLQVCVVITIITTRHMLRVLKCGSRCCREKCRSSAAALNLFASSIFDWDKQ